MIEILDIFDIATPFDLALPPNPVDESDGNSNLGGNRINTTVQPNRIDGALVMGVVLIEE